MGQFGGGIADTYTKDFSIYHILLGEGQIKYQDEDDLRPILENISNHSQVVYIDFKDFLDSC